MKRAGIVGVITFALILAAYRGVAQDQGQRVASSWTTAAVSGQGQPRGYVEYQKFCSACHGDVAVSGGVLPDLRYSGTLDSDQWFDVVLNGILKSRGMVSFEKDLTRADAAAIRAYVIFRANQSLADQKSTGH
jgi:mono/diheme cytochrome c family protein